MADNEIELIGSDTKHCFATLNGIKYHYLLGSPTGEPKGTVFLIHGWPDCSIGWRRQIPLFTGMGYRVVVPDMMGYGRTEAPEPLELYSLKRAADDIAELARQLGCPQIILGGHDWGGAIVYRVVMWHPKLVTHLFSICTPFFTVDKGPAISLEEAVEKYLPQFRYQLQLASGEVETKINNRETMLSFFRTLYGGRDPQGEMGFSNQKGLLFEKLPNIGDPPLLSTKEVEYYAQEYLRSGIHSTLNWYRTRAINHEQELSLEKLDIDIPTLFIAASRDAALPPAMSHGMEKHIPKLTRMEVGAGHWANTEAASDVNIILRAWLNAQIGLMPKSNL